MLIAGGVWEHARKHRAAAIAVILALCINAADTLRYAPDYLAYFNIFVQPQNSWRLLTDSNLDWGQGLIAVRHYEQQHPDETLHLAYFGSVDPSLYGVRAVPLAPNEPVKGMVIAGATCLSGQTLDDPQGYRWLWSLPSSAGSRSRDVDVRHAMKTYLTVVTTDDYAVGAVALWESLCRTRPDYGLVVVITKHVSEECDRRLQKAGLATLRIDEQLQRCARERGCAPALGQHLQQAADVRASAVREDRLSGRGHDGAAQPRPSLRAGRTCPRPCPTSSWPGTNRGCSFARP